MGQHFCTELLSGRQLTHKLRAKARSSKCRNSSRILSDVYCSCLHLIASAFAAQCLWSARRILYQEYARQTCNEVRSEFRTFRADVVEIIAVNALWNHSEPQHSIAWLQLIQSTTVIFTRSQQISTGSKIWFGTRGSEVQILSPRPLKSI